MVSSASIPEAELHATKVPTVYGASIVSIVIAGAFTCFRLISRRIQRQGLNASDWVLLGSVFCCWGMAIINMWFTTVGLGRHMEAIALEDPEFRQVKLLLKVSNSWVFCQGIVSHKPPGFHSGRNVLRHRNVSGQDLDSASLPQSLSRKDIVCYQQHIDRDSDRLVPFKSSSFDLFVSPHLRLLEL